MTLTDDQLERAHVYRTGFRDGVHDRTRDRRRGATLVLPDWWPDDHRAAKELGYDDGYEGRPRDSAQVYTMEAAP